jgi:Kef-type K+ transport system membrane component KefB/mannitol/fructose-specific phosphotransferase system IIA component (Ntr-type)
VSFHAFGPVNEIFAISLLMLAGFAGGKLANRLRLPAITGNILAGILIGPYGLHLLSHQAVTIDLKPITSFALGFVSFSIATHIDISEIKKTKGRILITGISDVLISSLFVAVTLYLWTKSLALALLMGAISGATAPATTLAVIRESRAKGPLTEALLPHVAFNNVVCVALFAFVFAGLKGTFMKGTSVTEALLHVAVITSIISIAIGFGTGLLLKAFFTGMENESFILPTMIISLLFVSGLSEFLHVSALISTMTLGFLTHNLLEQKEAVDKAFTSFEPLIYTAFFTLAGTHLDLSLLPALGITGVLYIISRFAGKWVGTFISAWLCRAPAVFRNLGGFTLLPQAGIALGLIVLIEEQPCCDPFSPAITAIVVAAVAFHEIIGPILTKATLKTAGEAGKDLHPVMGFLLPEGILPDLNPVDKWDAIRQLVGHLAEIYRLSWKQEDELLTSVIEREKSMTTGIGHRLAIPHGLFEGSGPIMGVMGISRRGVDFDAIDGDKSHIILLTAVHRDQLASHLDVLMKISRMFCREDLVQRLIHTVSQTSIYEILYDEEEKGFE